jgi:hypothetical protein
MHRASLKFIHKVTTRHGRVVYYFRRGRGRVRLPDIDAPNFRACYDRAMAGGPADVRDMPLSPITLRKQRVERALGDALRGARGRSKTKSVPFDLTLDWLLKTAEKQGFRCYLTGIEFFAKSGTTGKIDPFAPSLDRRVPRLGYTPGNVRIVIRAVNTMLLDWGDEIFARVANSYRYWQRTNGGGSIPAPFIPGPHLEKTQENSDA